MARKKAKSEVNATKPEKVAMPVRLDLTPTDHARLDKQARKRGLTKAAFVRMIVLGYLDELEEARK